MSNEVKTCGRIFLSPGVPQRVCGKPATHFIFGDKFFCDDCLNLCMEDGRRIARRASVKKFDEEE